MLNYILYGIEIFIVAYHQFTRRSISQEEIN